MKTEFEVKILDSDFESVKDKLKAVGGKRVHKRRMLKRWIIDYEDIRLQKSSAYIRVRDEGDKITTTYKLTEARTIDGVKEIETEVADSEAMIAIYERLGLKVHSYQETYRESWKVDGVEVEFDEWPWIAPFIEVEGQNAAQVEKVVKKLGYAWKDVVFGDVVQLYQDTFDINDWEIARHDEIKFGPIPDWLEAKRK